MKNLQIKRYLEDMAFSEIFSRQMRFITGPRQTGKTTLAKYKLNTSKCEKFYYNWDRKEIKNRYRRETDFLAKDLLENPIQGKVWVCFDEIHKMPKWKNILKDFFDTHEGKTNIIVTGSARLDMFRRSGDSLAGRYFLFKLNPLLFSEILCRKVDTILPESTTNKFIEKSITKKTCEQKTMEDILNFSSFPEPFLHGNFLFSKKWHNSYLEKIIKEDLRDISSIHQLEKVIDLLYLLPSKISAPLSINSLREDLELNYNTIKNYLNYFILTYVLFDVLPYQKKISRLIKKEKKIYFYDFAVIQDEPAKFENFVALELKSRIDLWNDWTQDKYEITFIRTRDGRETDFLILKNSIPWLLCEAKLSETEIKSHHFLHSRYLGHIPFVQLVKKLNVLKVEQKNFFVVSASRFLS